MEKHTFLIAGNHGEYKLTFYKKDGKAWLNCSCPAGEYGQHCRHAIALINGDTSMVIGNNIQEAAEIKNMVKGTRLEILVKNVMAAESVLKKAKKLVSEQKEELDSIMYPFGPRVKKSEKHQMIFTIRS